MLEVFKFFDYYTVRARILPALIAGFPTLALFLIVVPWNSFGLSHVIAVTVGFILLFAFADVARRSGRKVEAKLGSRATPELWKHNDTHIDSPSKNRYRKFVATKINLPAPTQEKEISDPYSSTQFYLSAGNWLRDQTRDTKKFKILFDELTTYGFRRNLLGLKLISLSMNALVLCLTILIIVLKPTYLNSIPGIIDKALALIIGVVLHSIFMAVAVSKEAVWEASRAYGKQLILSCETLMRDTQSSIPKVQKPKAAKTKE